MNKKQKRLWIGAGCIAAIFLLLNLAWFGWRHAAYSGYRDGMRKTEFSNVWHTVYVAQDADGFDYNVSYPSYPMLTGNLAIGYPATEDDPFTDGLIIWPKLSGGYEYGVILNPRGDDAEGYMFYIDAQGNAVDAEYREIAEEARDVIKTLLTRANSQWKLK